VVLANLGVTHLDACAHHGWRPLVDSGSDAWSDELIPPLRALTGAVIPSRGATALVSGSPCPSVREGGPGKAPLPKPVRSGGWAVGRPTGPSRPAGSFHAERASDGESPLLGSGQL
jgi:hypothetical protein